MWITVNFHNLAPLRRRTTRSAASASAALCVISIMVLPSRFFKSTSKRSTFFPVSKVERAGRFVAQQQLGVFRQSASNGDTLLLTAGKLCRKVIARSDRPTSSRTSSTSMGLALISVLTSTFSRAVRLGTRL